MFTNRDLVVQCPNPEQRALLEFCDNWLGIYFNNFDKTMPLVCSLRAETIYDVAVLIKALCEHDIAFKINWWLCFGSPDVMVELITEASVEQLRDIMREHADTHVMIQTIRPVPLRENNLERDLNIPG